MKHAEEELDISRQLKEKNPYRYEPGYAMALNNYANRLREVGQYEEALNNAKEALDIYNHLAAILPVRFNEDVFNTKCLVCFLCWLSHKELNKNLNDLDVIPSVNVKDREKLLLFYSLFIKACWNIDSVKQKENFKQAIVFWKDLSPVSQNKARAYWICAGVWGKSNIPEDVSDKELNMNWQKYTNQNQGKLPQWMQEMARRLEFEWPT